MKRFPLLLFVLLPMLAWAEDILRGDGTVVKGAILRAEPDGLVVQTDAGIEKVEFVMLSPEVQKRFNYDRAKAEEYRAKRVAAQQQAAGQQLAAVRAQSRGRSSNKSSRSSSCRRRMPAAACSSSRASFL